MRDRAAILAALLLGAFVATPPGAPARWAGAALAQDAAQGGEQESAEQDDAAQSESARSEAPQDEQAEPAATVGMTDDLRYDPESITIEVGETVLWRNSSNVAHTVTADPEKAANEDSVRLPEGAGTFDSGNMAPGAEFRYTFETPGRYTYFCIPHEQAGMIGEIVVEAVSDPDEAREQEDSQEQEAQAQAQEEGRQEEGQQEAGQQEANDEEAQAEEAQEETGQAGTSGDAAESEPAEGETPPQGIDIRSQAVQRGEYLAIAGGCASCHTENFSGGVAIETEFGVFHPPNITPDVETGIGDWTEQDFVRAMKLGLNPDSQPYYPVFPYAWFTSIYEFDLRDLFAYLRSLEPVRNEVPPHALSYPFSERELIHGWRALDFETGPAPADPARSPAWNRGSYLVNALAHCGACNTTKTSFGTWRDEMYLAGSSRIPSGHIAPNITPDDETGIGRWSEDEIVELLQTGVDPDGNFMRGEMARVVSDTTSRLTDDDRAAIAEYLSSIPPIRNVPGEVAEHEDARHEGSHEDGEASE